MRTQPKQACLTRQLNALARAGWQHQGPGSSAGARYQSAATEDERACLQKLDECWHHIGLPQRLQRSVPGTQARHHCRSALPQRLRSSCSLEDSVSAHGVAWLFL